MSDSRVTLANFAYFVPVPSDAVFQESNIFPFLTNPFVGRLTVQLEVVVLQLTGFVVPEVAPFPLNSTVYVLVIGVGGVGVGFFTQVPPSL
jgi:hypothetical protein